MTATLNWSTVTNSIAALSISGVTVKDIDEITDSMSMQTAILSPRPDGFISDITITRDSFGTGGAEKMTAIYTLTYRYYHAPIAGGLGGLFSTYSGMITNIDAICEAILNNDAITGCVDILLAGISELGPVEDPSGNIYHGCDLSFQVTEFVT